MLISALQNYEIFPDFCFVFHTIFTSFLQFETGSQRVGNFSKLLAPKTKENAEWIDYLKQLHGGEAATNAMEIGRRMGLKPGAPWPGKEKAMELFKKFSESTDPKNAVFNAYNWKLKPRRVWDALTGRYFVIGVGVTTAASLSSYNGR